MKPVGYSGTPLEKKLGFKPGFRSRVINPPDNYYSIVSNIPADLIRETDENIKKDLIHYFTKSVAQLNEDIKQLRLGIVENGMIWISWPKRSSKVATDLNENIIRDIALQNGLVDVKVCAVDEIWCGLKLVIRKTDRKKQK